LQGAVTAGALNVTGASLLQLGVSTGSLNVTGESWLQGAVTVGALNVTGAALLELGLTGGSLNITGESWLQGAVTAGALNVTGDSILENNLTVTTGSVTISTNDYDPIFGNTPVGGAIVFNTVDVSPSMGDISRERSFQAANNQSAAANITGFVFNNSVVRAFDAIVSVIILVEGGSNKYAYYNLKGIQKASNWVLNSSYVGDSTGFTFSIDNNGQIKYTSTNVSGYLSSYVNFRALTTTVNP
jgi:hypothetical protein